MAAPLEAATLAELAKFSQHCALIRSVYCFAERLWRKSTEEEHELIDRLCPTLNRDIGDAIAEYIILAAARINDLAIDGKGNRNLTLEVFYKTCATGAADDPLAQLSTSLAAHGKLLKPARDKLLAHHDRATIASDKPLAAATWEQWDSFWCDLSKFVNLVNERMKNGPFSIDVAGVYGDAEVLIKAFTMIA